MDKMTQVWNWTIQQVAIFAWFLCDNSGRALVVRARAGTGKTTTIKEGIKRLMIDAKAKGITIKVLATSFTRKTVDALQDALTGIAGVEVRSLNQLGAFYCRQNGARMTDASKANRAWDLARHVEPKADRETHALLVKLHTKARELAPFATCGADLEALAESFGLVPTTEMVSDGWTLAGLCEAAYECLDIAGRHFSGGIDFADQTFLPLRNGWTYPIYDRVIVDETQDMTEPQLTLAQRSCRSDAGFCIVGDDQQAIFGFRGADINGLDRLKGILNAEECGLTVTYRCPKSHVALAKILVPDYECGENAPEGVINRSDIASMLDKACPGDFILSRTNAPLMGLCFALLRRGIRAYVAGRDFGAMVAGIVKRTKAVLVVDMLIAISTWKDAQIAKIGNDKMAQNDEWLQNQTDLIDDQVGTIVSVADGCATVKEVLARLDSLFAEASDVPAVMLSTVHKAKGLESDHTWICDATFMMRNDEDRRVRYVALTRAKHEMTFVDGFGPVGIDARLAA